MDARQANSGAGETPQVIRREDYAPPGWRIAHVDLAFDLRPRDTRVQARLQLQKTGDDTDLRLDGEHLELISIAIDGTPLPADRYALDETGLTLLSPPERFVLETEAQIAPVENTRLEGLYQSSGNYCTQCEAEGFRSITWFLDRPDVMTTFRVVLRAERSACPVLLSNGNLIEQGDLGDGRHFAIWHDPFPKPSYLFALVAGDLDLLADRFETRSGRQVALNIYVDKGQRDKAGWAMDCLKRSMRWDEERFDLEYDLDIFNIVAVRDFNMGAMENKSLNVFNSRYILADPETATDADYSAIEAVVAHEYFHNWTGNRVTCRDWFQLSLKEGLTVFRDQEFSADMRSAAVKRIKDVSMLRARQFPEDAGPLAHPVRPDSYIEINNFYTATVYEKGAEVIRMMHTLLGREGFKRGMALYFERHDGQAVTCDDFVAAMEEANDADLGRFRRWYGQAGTPTVSASGSYDAATRRYALTLTQETPPTPGQAEKQPLEMPIAVGLLGESGGELAARTLMLNQARQTFAFEDVEAPMALSLNRGFSAPVLVADGQDQSARGLLMRADGDPFARWEAGQQLAQEVMLEAVPDAGALRPGMLRDGFAAVLETAASDPAFAAQMLALPGEETLAERMSEIDVDGIHDVRQALRRHLGEALRDPLERTYRACESNAPYLPDAEQSGRRALKNAALAYLSCVDGADTLALITGQYHGAGNMTDRMAALMLLADRSDGEADSALADFHDRHADDPLVLDKWFSVQALSRRPDTLQRVVDLLRHPAFSLRNPNNVRALIGAFAANPVRFHAADGSGYDFFAERILELDPINPQVAARVVQPLGRWQRHQARRQQAMRQALERILAAPALSRDTYEIVSKSLA